jgi:hypothetical protein
MRYRRDVLLLVPTITAIFFITDYNVLFDSNVQAERQSQSTNTVCNGEQDSCFTTFCSNDQPCQTFPSNQLPSEEATVMQPAEEATVMQPAEEATVMQPAEEATVMQPVEVSQEYIEATLEVCDDGQDNDVDGKVDSQDEECNATSPSSPSPIQEQSMSEDQNQKEGEDDKQQSDNDKLERPSQEDREESGEDDEGEKDEDDNNEQQDENDDN